MKQIQILVLVLLIGGLYVACDSRTYDDVSADPIIIEDDVTYTANVKAIIDGNCVSCHVPGGVASFRPLTTYAEVKAAVESTNLLERIQRQSNEQGVMPLSGRMSQNNIDIVLQWNIDGLQE